MSNYGSYFLWFGSRSEELMNYVSKILKELPKDDLIQVEERVVYTLETDEKDFDIVREGENYIVTGPAVDRIMRRVNIQDKESMHYLQKRLEDVGVFARLREMKIKEGDTVKILDWEFEWYN